MDINWSTDHTKDKLPFSYEIVEVIDSKKVNMDFIKKKYDSAKRIDLTTNQRRIYV